jgi:thiol-disulfide isomerase/thioredoxin
MSRGLIALVTLVALAACTGGTGEGSAAGPHPSGGPPCVAAASAPSGPPSSGPALADLRLRCFAGGAEVRLARLGRPLVVNLWASWCGPCREELPAFEQFAQRAAGRIAVIGVATRTSRDAAGSIIDDLGLTFPTLYDYDQKLLHAVERTLLPVTLFVDARGHVAYVYNSTTLDVPAIERLAAQHLGA